MISITELAEHIVLDDVTDTFYRTLCFSNFSRSAYDPRTLFEQKLDENISKKLSRQLNWSSCVCSLENSTHRITHLLSLFLQGKLQLDELSSQLEDNYWLAASAEKELGQEQFMALVQSQQTSPKIGSDLSAVICRYFKLQLNKPYRELAEQAQLFSQLVLELAIEQVEDEQSKQELEHLAFLNLYPFIVLLMLLDKTVQSAKQELLNQIGFECETSREQVTAYQPSAEQVLSFLIFDEFVKYHIHDNLYGYVKTNLGIGNEQNLHATQKLFLRARTNAILNSLAHIPILTPEQKARFAEQLGIQAEIKPDLSATFARLLKRLMPSKFEYNISLPV